VLFLALVFILTILVVPTAPARALTFPQFGDSIHDYGIDLDGNHLYDELRIDFTATVQENGTYGFEAQHSHVHLRLPRTLSAQGRCRRPVCG